MAPRDDLPTPEEFAADRIPNTPEVAPKPFTMHAPTVKAFSMNGRTGQPSSDPAWGSGNSYASTANTQQVQDTGLGPANTNPEADQPADPNRKPSPFTEVGASGLAQYGGFVRDEFLPQLQGDRGLRVYREMYDNDPIVGALVFIIQMLMRKVEWRVEPPESATVEGIVATRQKERMDLLQAKAQEKQSQLMMAQAGIAGKSEGASFTAQSPTGATVGGPGAIPQKPTAASPLSEPATPFHQPVPGLEGKTSPPGPQSTGPQPGTTPSAQTPSAHPSSGSTPPNQPGPNAQPNSATSPSTNYPARPNTPSANPSGGPNQHGALTGADGLPGDRPRGLAQPSDPSTDTDIGGMPKVPLKKEWEVKFQEWWEQVSKAGSSAGGAAGGIQSLDVGDNPTDPETGEPMDFPVGTDLLAPPSPEEQHALELAVFVETALHDMSDSWSDTISQIITMVVYGFALHELVYKKRNGPNPDDPIQGSRFADGRIGWAKIAGRAQETRHRWEFDEFGNVLGMWQLAPPKFQLKYIPLSKALLFRTTGYKQNPEGRSILRSAYRPWYFKRRIEEIEAVGVERDLAGLPIAYVPYQMMSPYASPEERAALNEIKQIVRNIRRDEQEGIVFPAAYDPDSHQPMYKFELISSPSRRSFDTDKIITRYDQRIAMVALVDFILLGQESVGSRALADTKVDLFTTALEAWLNVIADVFNTSAIPRLMQINGEDPAMSPRLAFGKMSRISLVEISALITSMASAGADLFPDPALEDFLREAGGMPAKSASDDL